MSGLFCHAVFALLVCVDNIVGDCFFPNYTINNPRWETRISMERRMVGAHWMFNQTTVEFTDLTKKQTSYKYSCYMEVNSNTFLMRLIAQNEQSSVNDQSAQNQDTGYICAEFAEHSSNVLQLTLSPPSPIGSPEILCGGNHSNWDNQILIWPQIDQSESCPVTGGFRFSMTDYSNGMNLCADSFLPPYFESDCLENEGIHIDFQNFYCRGGLGMQLRETLFCLGSWTEGNFIYSVTINTDTTWPKVWLFRYPNNMQDDQFDVELLTEVKVITTSISDISADHYTLHFTRELFPSICEDEATQCSNCSNNDFVVFCQKSCDACISSLPGNFSSNATGNWTQFSMSGTINVTVSTSTMSVANLTFFCLSLTLNNWYMTKDRKSMAITFTNGCRPRYLCVDFIRRSDAVLQYRLSQYVSSGPMTADDICSEVQFADRTSQPTTDISSHKYKAVVKSNRVGLWQEVSCGFGRGHFHLVAHFPSGKVCKSLIDSCESESDSSFEFVMSADCDDETLISSEQHCLATFTDDMSGDLVMITEDNSTRAAYCWFLHKEEWESVQRLYFTYAADCNSDVAKFIVYKDYAGYLAYFDISPGTGLLGSYSCLEDTSTWFNASTAPASDTGILSGSSTSATDHQNPKNAQGPSQDNNKANIGQASIPINYTFVLFTISFCAFFDFFRRAFI